MTIGRMNASGLEYAAALSGRLGTVILGVVAMCGCTPSEPNNLDKMSTVRMSIKDKTFKLWVADEISEQLRGLMYVTGDQIAPLSDGTERGMIFAFPTNQANSFWMKNTYINLDIAYVAADGRVVTIYTMAALDERPNQYAPSGPYRFAIEVAANRLTQLGLKKGDHVEIPASLLNPAP